MKRMILFLSFAMVATEIVSAADREKNSERPQGPAVKAGKIPYIPHQLWPAVTEARRAEIKEWIAQLAGVDGPGFGYASTLSGSAFAPQPESAQTGTMMLTVHALKASQALLHLVEAGPDAMPLLLEKLDDATPTKYTVQHGSGFGAMWTSVEMSVNPGNPQETSTPITERGVPQPAPRFDAARHASRCRE